MYVEITKCCDCEHDKCEMMTNPRDNLIVQHFEVGQKLIFEKEWSNLSCEFYRVKTNQGFADIKKENAKIYG